VKTTIELGDTLLAEVKQRAHERNTTMREIIESALRLYLEGEDTRRSGYRFENHSFRGNGVREGIREGAWEEVRAAIYEGRGG
jgi:Arc/MetJ family transcription regulator